jgi:hypothetical protein
VAEDRRDLRAFGICSVHRRAQQLVRRYPSRSDGRQARAGAVGAVCYGRGQVNNQCHKSRPHTPQPSGSQHAIQEKSLSDSAGNPLQILGAPLGPGILDSRCQSV